MSNNLGYTRKFIILRKDYSTMAHLNPKGHGKLEIKGLKATITLNIENGERDTFYNVSLIGPKENHNLGKFYIEENRKGYGEFTFNIKDLEGIGFSLDKINGILIMKDRDVLIGGYFNKVDNSIEKFMNSLEEVVEFVEVVEVVEEPIEIVGSHIEEEVETIEVTEPLEFVEPLRENVTEEVILVDTLEPEEESLVWEELFEEIQEPTFEEVFASALEELFQPEEKVVEEFDYHKIDMNNKIIQRDQTTSYIMNILRYFPYADPFKINLKGYNWWKINIDLPNEDRGFLPYYSYITGGNHKYPIIENAITANELMRKHKHYLFGLYNVDEEVKFYVYGVPGNFTSEEHPQKGLTGFNTWYEDHNNMGYWLLYIDPLTGKVIYPINPMIPIE